MGLAPAAHSEPEDRAECDSQVVMRSPVEVDFISGFQAQAEWTKRARDAGSRIKSGIQVRGAESEDGTREIAVRKQARAETEIGEPGFEGCVRMDVTSGALKLGADESLGYANGCAFDASEVSVRNVAIGFIEVKTVVVGELSFQYDAGIDAVAEASTHPEIVSAGLRNSEVVEKNAGFDVVVGGAVLGE